MKPLVLPGFIAFSKGENKTKTAARYLGSYIMFWLIFQCLAANYWEERHASPAAPMNLPVKAAALLAVW